MIRTKSTRTLALAGFVPAGKLVHSYCCLLPLALCVATAAWSQTPSGLRNRVPPNPLSGVQQATPAAATPASAEYRFVSIEILGATGTSPGGLYGGFAYGIDNAGVVTGLYNDASNNSHGFVWYNGTLGTLDNPGSLDTALSSVSNLEVAAGYYGDSTTAHAATYSFQSGAWSMLPDISGMPNNEAYGINKSGVVIGVAGGGGFNGPSTAASWVWDPSSQSYTFFNVPGAEQYSTYDDAINDRGQVVGSYDDSSGLEHGFLKDGETYTTIDVGAIYTVAYGINNHGTIVGYWGNLSGWNEGFVRTSDGTVTVVDFPGALETQVGNINDRGDICGLWVDPKTGVWTPFVGFKK